MGRRKAQRNKGGGGVGHKTHQNKQMASLGSHNGSGGGHYHHNKPMELELASKFQTRTTNTTESDEDGDDQFFANEVVEEVVSKAMIQHVMLNGAEELDSESFLEFFEDNFMCELLAKCGEHQYHRRNPNYSSDDSGDDIAFDFRFSNESPFYSNNKPKKNQNGKSRKKKKGRFNNMGAHDAFKTLIKMLLIQCVIEDEIQRQKRRRWMKLFIIFVPIIVFVVYYFWW